jgi:hypothetical protein
VEIMKNTARCGIGLMLLLGLAALPASAQDQTPSASQDASSGSSLGAYARQVRKDPGTASKPKVFDNDNLPREDKLSVVGPTLATATDESVDAKASQSEGSAAIAPGAKAASQNQSGGEGSAPQVKPPSSEGAPPPDEEATKQAAAKQWGEKLTSQKDQIDLLARELDVLQREYQIRAAAMYADAGNRIRNSADWDKQDAQYKQQITDKQKALDEAKQKLDDMQEDARKAGVPASVREP